MAAIEPRHLQRAFVLAALLVLLPPLAQGDPPPRYSSYAACSLERLRAAVQLLQGAIQSLSDPKSNNHRDTMDKIRIIERQLRDPSHDLCSLYLTQRECLRRIRCSHDPSQSSLPHCVSAEVQDDTRTCMLLPSRD